MTGKTLALGTSCSLMSFFFCGIYINYIASSNLKQHGEQSHWSSCLNVSVKKRVGVSAEKELMTAARKIAEISKFHIHKQHTCFRDVITFRALPLLLSCPHCLAFYGRASTAPHTVAGICATSGNSVPVKCHSWHVGGLALHCCCSVTAMEGLWWKGSISTLIFLSFVLQNKGILNIQEITLMWTFSFIGDAFTYWIQHFDFMH